VIFWRVDLILLLMKIILVVCGFSKTIRAANVSLLFMKIFVICE
jgi:hypothetical protein